MKVHFIIKNKNNPTNLVCRFKPHQNYDFSNVTGIWVNREDWNATKQQVKQRANTTNKDLINSTLKELEQIIIDKWVKDNLHNTPISRNWLKVVINTYFRRANNDELHLIYFTDWVQKFVDDAPKRLYKGKHLAPKTIQNYKVAFAKLQAFENNIKTKIKFENIDLHFYRDFVNYCRDVEKLNPNSIGSIISKIKLWCKNIELDGLPINPQYKHSDFTTLSNKTKDVYLNDLEIDKIYNYDFANNERLDNARDLFMIGLRTGLRVSDFMRLTLTNIDKDVISITTKKTKQSVIIGMHPQIKSILAKRNGNLPRAISDQKFNLYVKDICELVGINEKVEGSLMDKDTGRKEVDFYPKYKLISSHTCRRSFASNLYGKVPTKSIMAITGHQTETQFLKYIKITQKEHAEMLIKYWDEETKGKEISPLRIAK